MTTTPLSVEYINNSETTKGYEVNEKEWDAFRKVSDADSSKREKEKEEKESDLLRELGIESDVDNQVNPEDENQQENTPDLEPENNFEGFVDDHDENDFTSDDLGFGEGQ